MDNKYRKIYFGGFDSRKNLEREFDVRLGKDTKILFAFYDNGGYEGSATVVFSKGEKLYHVYGSHCSCYGLEGQWQPEETTVKHIKHLFITGDYQYKLGYDDEPKLAFFRMLERLERKDILRYLD